MTSITIFGTGNMGTAIGGALSRGGATIQHIEHGDPMSRIEGDVIVLAVPYAALREIVASYGDQFAGKAVVDISNPVDFSTFDSLVVPAGTSAAAELQKLVPAARVVKAFNTNFAATLASGTVGDAVTTVLMAGDDADAKAALAALISAGGLGVVDAGSLARAHELESLGFLQLTLAAAEKISWNAGFALTR